MNDNAPNSYARSPQHLQYQSPGAHQKSQWITDEGTIGKILVVLLIVASVILAVLGGIGALVGWYLGWW
jgi:hypothetical protein